MGSPPIGSSQGAEQDLTFSPLGPAGPGGPMGPVRPCGGDTREGEATMSIPRQPLCSCYVPILLCPCPAVSCPYPSMSPSFRVPIPPCPIPLCPPPLCPHSIMSLLPLCLCSCCVFVPAVFPFHHVPIPLCPHLSMYLLTLCFCSHHVPILPYPILLCLYPTISYSFVSPSCSVPIRLCPCFHHVPIPSHPHPPMSPSHCIPIPLCPHISMYLLPLCS